MQLAILLVVGLSAGVLSVVMGVGGGILIVPALVYFVKVGMKAATATSLVAIIPTAIAGVILRSSAHEVNWRYAVLVSVGAVVGTFIGVHLGKMASELLIKRLFACLMVVAAVQMFWSTLRPR